MSKNILVKDVLLTDDIAAFPLQLDKFGASIQQQIEKAIKNEEAKSDLDDLSNDTTEEAKSDLEDSTDTPDAQENPNDVTSTPSDVLGNPNDIVLNNMGEIFTGSDHDFISGIAEASAVSNATATAEVIVIADEANLSTADADSDATADAEALAVGLDITERIFTNKGQDTIIGIANASALGTALANSQAELVLGNISYGDSFSDSIAKVNVVATAIGISNASHVSTGKANDAIIGIANAFASGSSVANSKATSVFGDDSYAAANSESTVVVETLAIGIDNLDKITTGKGHDVMIGIADAAGISAAEATAFAHNTTGLATTGASVVNDLHFLNQFESAISSARSEAVANSNTTSLGILNSGRIMMDRGDDVIIGLASSTSSSTSQVLSEAESIAKDVAIATADGRARAIVEGAAVGIANLGIINTGMNNDTIIGIALNDDVANADADADADAFAEYSDAKTDTDAIADTSEVLAIGIDNSSGVILAARGDDKVIGLGTVGITGGIIRAGKGHDRVLGYGSDVGVEDIRVELGHGDDFFKAAIADFDPLTGQLYFSEDQSGSIKDAHILGNRGNDTFEIGGFESTVSIDGGIDHDVLKLSGHIEDYEISLGSFGNQAVVIEDHDSTLMVKNVEAFYFGNSDHVYSFHDFA